MKTATHLIGILLILLVAFAAYMGAFATITVGEELRGPYRVVYRTLDQADFENVGDVSGELDRMLASIEVDDRRPFDVYYPDGSAEIGFEVQVQSLEIALSNGTRVRTIPEEKMMVASFPWRNPASFMVGYYKVDPALAEYRAKRGYTQSVQMAHFDNGLITYMQPVR